MSLLGPEKFNSLMALCEGCEASGVFAECGVFDGEALASMARLCPERTFYGFDTFEGMPKEMWRPDEPHVPGEFKPPVLPDMPANVRLVKGLFPNSAPFDLNYGFVHLDFDFYESTIQALRYLLPRLTKDAIIVFDDLDWRNTPGVRRAIHELNLKVEPTVTYQGKYVHEF